MRLTGQVLLAPGAREVQTTSEQSGMQVVTECLKLEYCRQFWNSLQAAADWKPAGADIDEGQKVKVGV